MKMDLSSSRIVEDKEENGPTLTRKYNLYLGWDEIDPHLKVEMELGDLVTVSEAIRLGLEHLDVAVKNQNISLTITQDSSLYLLCIADDDGDRDDDFPCLDGQQQVSQIRMRDFIIIEDVMAPRKGFVPSKGKKTDMIPDRTSEVYSLQEGYTNPQSKTRKNKNSKSDGGCCCFGGPKRGSLDDDLIE